VLDQLLREHSLLLGAIGSLKSYEIYREKTG
jgi:hypothetical protein